MVIKMLHYESVPITSFQKGYIWQLYLCLKGFYPAKKYRKPTFYRNSIIIIIIKSSSLSPLSSSSVVLIIVVVIHHFFVIFIIVVVIITTESSPFRYFPACTSTWTVNNNIGSPGSYLIGVPDSFERMPRQMRWEPELCRHRLFVHNYKINNCWYATIKLQKDRIPPGPHGKCRYSRRQPAGITSQIQMWPVEYNQNWK